MEAFDSVYVVQFQRVLRHPLFDIFILSELKFFVVAKLVHVFIEVSTYHHKIVIWLAIFLLVLFTEFYFSSNYLVLVF